MPAKFFTPYFYGLTVIWQLSWLDQNFISAFERIKDSVILLSWNFFVNFIHLKSKYLIQIFLKTLRRVTFFFIFPKHSPLGQSDTEIYHPASDVPIFYPFFNSFPKNVILFFNFWPLPWWPCPYLYGQDHQGRSNHDHDEELGGPDVDVDVAVAHRGERHQGEVERVEYVYPVAVSPLQVVDAHPAAGMGLEEKNVKNEKPTNGIWLMQVDWNLIGWAKFKKTKSTNGIWPRQSWRKLTGQQNSWSGVGWSCRQGCAFTQKN